MGIATVSNLVSRDGCYLAGYGLAAELLYFENSKVETYNDKESIKKLSEILMKCSRLPHNDEENTAIRNKNPHTYSNIIECIFLKCTYPN